VPHASAVVKTLGQVWRQPSNAGQRGRRVAQALVFQYRSRLRHQSMVVRYGDHSKICAQLDGNTSKRAVYFTLPDPPEMSVWRRRLGPGDLFVDVGANIGLYSILALDCGAEVVAVEPGAAARQQLEQNLRVNGYDAEVLDVALSDEAGRSWISGPDPTRNALDPLGCGAGATPVALRTLDDVLGDRCAAGVKIDVEGAERLVVAGARRALEDRRIHLLQLEWNETSLLLLGEDRRPVADALRDVGYELVRPNAAGQLETTSSVEFGPDLFARPVIG
jgi:FkbM family methyltransferase